MHIRIQPDFSLAETARIVGEVLDAPFTYDDSGYFEEFPAYSSPGGDTRFALIGPPDPQFMVGPPWHHYELQVRALSGTEQEHGALLADTQKRIVSDGRLRSELL